VPTIGRVLKKFLHHSSTEFISPLDRWFYLIFGKFSPFCEILKKRYDKKFLDFWKKFGRNHQNSIQHEKVLKIFLLLYFEYCQILAKYSYGWCHLSSNKFVLERTKRKTLASDGGHKT
jgi:hypothetical protein